MVDPLTIVNGALGITTNAILLCKQTYELVNGTRKAPGYMTRVPGGLRGLLPVLRNLESRSINKQRTEPSVDLPEDDGQYIRAS